MKEFYRIKNDLFLLVFLVLFIVENRGQVSSYNFSESNGTYVSISGTAAMNPGWDENTVPNIPIGFTFNFNNSNYTACTISSNGFITFGSTSPTNSLYNPISSTISYTGAISAIGADLIDGGTKAITYSTTGTAPYRIFTIQWDDARRYSGNGNFDFQIKLYETTNTISVVYGICSPTGTTTTENINVEVGLRGTSNTDFNNRNKTNHSNWALTTTKGTFNTDSCTTNGSSAPSNGLTFTWAPIQTCLTPTAQPSALVLTPGTTTIAGNFAAASPSPNSYLVVRSNTSIKPNPINGTFYPIGSTALGANYVVIDTDSNTSFNDSGLITSTSYYYHIFSYNNTSCTGGPKYNTTNPLSASTTTTTNFTYCTPSSSSSNRYINSLESVGTVTTYANNNTGYSPGGYGNYRHINLFTQIQGGGVNLLATLPDKPNSQTIRIWIDWNNKDGLFNNTNELVYTTGSIYTELKNTLGFTIPHTIPAGTYTLRIRTFSSNTLDPCNNYSGGETEDYTITILADCSAKINAATSGTSCGAGPVTLQAYGTTDITEFRWYDSVTNILEGTSPSTIVSGQATTTWITPSLNTSKTYIVKGYNGTCQSYYNTFVDAEIKSTTEINVAASAPTICGENSQVKITATVGETKFNLLTETFSELDISDTNFRVTQTLNNTSYTNATWKLYPSPSVPISTTVFKPAISSGNIDDRFALTTSDYYNLTMTSRMITKNTVSTVGCTTATLSFRHYYSDFDNTDTAAVYYSTLASPDPANSSHWTLLIMYNSDQGLAHSFTSASYSLPVGIQNLSIKFEYKGTWAEGWAIDDVYINATKPFIPNYLWNNSSGIVYIDTNNDNVGDTPYTNQNVSSIYFAPNGLAMESPSWSTSVKSLTPNGCVSTVPISITNTTRTWKGTINNNWDIAGNWAPAFVPDATTCVIIPSTAKIIGTAYSGYGKNLTIKSTGDLELQADNNLIITDWMDIKNGGVFNVRNNANFVQKNDNPSPANTISGTFTMDRTAIGLKALDYIYWSSPVNNFPVTSVSPNSLTSKIYHWVTDYPNPNGFGFGNWFNTTENMQAGKGYIIRVANNNPTFSTTFTGAPRNGIITKTIARGPYIGSDYRGSTGRIITNLDDNLNLIGNPYPSAIDAIEFLTENQSVLEGGIQIWTHKGTISNSNPSPFYQNFSSNYSYSDYLTYTKLGSSIGSSTGADTGFNGKIAAGQGFLVKMKDGNALTANITFKNSMRTDDLNRAYNNSQFYRTTDNKKEKQTDRIWIDLVDNTSSSDRFLIGYTEDATAEKDFLFDAKTDYEAPLKAFSLLDNDAYVIQGKGPFDINDKFNIGYQVPANGNYKFAISEVDGIFKTNNQKIYIEDLLTNTTHDLTTSPYSFTSEKGLFKTRFIIKYTNETLSNNDSEYKNSVFIYGTNELHIKSELFNLKNIEIYDVLGKTLIEAKDINQMESLINLKNTQSMILVKIMLENGAIITKKVIY
ncbi:GEVED domain-containing protein [Flavobacterium oreochromis]|uniref:GEVED domain-containing protein n=1 Tax=Flavobacterium columnare TaxID=996 RepID=A0A2D0AI29_9FLAO|nr:GEVED domain-containing protein [Flavobacterium oreochromis]OWP79476.1 hypothetical protein BWK62_01930 [Flavobacterium oreochromis]